ncbi:hypothetical protein BRADI_1g51051v3 [Brachypodium distachyon]|uniref:RING-type domain-containing protein n=1 Tax=Brachypodium distachyon TaxID=15368 RepID=A0A0Q3JQ66_BRADI|nr:hypothetical protein BRADI_1g51051v3 [Brachypodium distachyon]
MDIVLDHGDYLYEVDEQELLPQEEDAMDIDAALDDFFATELLQRERQPRRRRFVVPDLNLPPPAKDDDDDDLAAAALKDTAAPDGSAYPICLLDDEEDADMTPGAWKETACGHKFHGPCIEEWLRGQGSCPICRRELVIKTPTPTADPDDADIDYLALAEEDMKFIDLAGNFGLTAGDAMDTVLDHDRLYEDEEQAEEAMAMLLDDHADYLYEDDEQEPLQEEDAMDIALDDELQEGHGGASFAQFDAALDDLFATELQQREPRRRRFVVPDLNLPPPAEEDDDDDLASALKDTAAPHGSACPICLLDDEEDDMAGACGAWKETACGHKFHGRCISKWLRDNGSCPMCRRQLVPERKTTAAEDLAWVDLLLSRGEELIARFSSLQSSIHLLIS